MISMKCFIANDGQEGINMAREIMPDLVISDIMMPVKSGTELCQELKGSFTTSHIPIILLTAKTAKRCRKSWDWKQGQINTSRNLFTLMNCTCTSKNLLELKYRIRHNFGKLLKLEPDKLVFSSEDDLFLENALKLIEQNMDKSDFRIEDFCQRNGCQPGTFIYKVASSFQSYAKQLCEKS